MINEGYFALSEKGMIDEFLGSFVKYWVWNKESEHKVIGNVKVMVNVKVIGNNKS